MTLLMVVFFFFFLMQTFLIFMKSSLLIFPIIASALCDILRKAFPDAEDQKTIYTMISSNILVALLFTFGS